MRKILAYVERGPKMFRRQAAHRTACNMTYVEVCINIFILSRGYLIQYFHEENAGKCYIKIEKSIL